MRIALRLIASNSVAVLSHILVGYDIKEGRLMNLMPEFPPSRFAISVVYLMARPFEDIEYDVRSLKEEESIQNQREAWFVSDLELGIIDITYILIREIHVGRSHRQASWCEEVAMAISMREGKGYQDWACMLLGACLFVSPWIFGFTGEMMPSWNAWIVAVLLIVLASAALSAFAEWEEWASMALGVWLIASPWLLGFVANASARWTDIVLGVLVVAASLWGVWNVHHPHAHA
ncbi:SPW repeat-containing protein [Rhizobium miluonense]|uniref:SPW repeat-containing protein n=2 Tax=Rhizobium/Agrobacterium group TaxID=227290 RepID=A0A1C3WVB7_9HYPH|nr:SPW repeat-containing protein [Rhizobium miluonense]